LAQQTTVGKKFRGYMDEWISYHVLIGVHHIYVGLNECGKDLAEAKQTLQKYIDAGVVTYDPVAECRKELVHIKLLNRVSRGRVKSLLGNSSRFVNETGSWLIALDSDEFLVVDDPLVSIGQMAAWFEENSWESVYLQWRLFGTSGLVVKAGSVLESFDRRLPTVLEAGSFKEVDSALRKCRRFRGGLREKGKSITRAAKGRLLGHHRSPEWNMTVWGLVDGGECHRRGLYGCECSKPARGGWNNILPDSFASSDIEGCGSGDGCGADFETAERSFRSKDSTFSRHSCSTASNVGPLWINHYFARGERMWQERTKASWVDAKIKNWYQGCDERPPVVLDRVKDPSAVNKVLVRLSFLLHDLLPTDAARRPDKKLQLTAGEILQHLLPTTCFNSRSQTAEACIQRLCKSRDLKCAGRKDREETHKHLAGKLAWKQSQALLRPQSDCVGEWKQCGGSSWKGATCCTAGNKCVYESAAFSKCQGVQGKETTAEAISGKDKVLRTCLERFDCKKFGFYESYKCRAECKRLGFADGRCPLAREAKLSSHGCCSCEPHIKTPIVTPKIEEMEEREVHLVTVGRNFTDFMEVRALLTTS
jgi:hypothetical protein